MNHIKTQAAQTLWITGLSASGKSTIAKAFHQLVQAEGLHSYILDGDILREGLNSNLGFSPEDRHENVRRTAEVAKLMNHAGINVIVSMISPMCADRELAKKIIGEKAFCEIYLSTSLATCEKRDPKSLYRKARNHELLNFTGISAPYEVPINPSLIIDTAISNIEESVDKLYQHYCEIQSRNVVVK